MKKKDERVKEGIYKNAEAHDIVKYGSIPELVGRLPVIVSLDDLDRDALVRIVSEPKNALVKQYKKLFALDGVELQFEKGALAAIAEKAIERGTGARGLRAIIEEQLLGIMYEIPSKKDEVGTVIVTREVITKRAKPKYLPRTAETAQTQAKPIQKGKKVSVKKEKAI